MYDIGIQKLGVANGVFGTRIWTFQLAGTNVGLWQEYALFFTLPMSFVGFPIGSWVGRDGPSPTAAGVIG